ncbi:hypothetical protein LBMAG46_24900 [Planctomycetia bacterium]|nr:hypothetical protein LBMAG46_24900 [Planctomycetia bacterium]
MEGLQHIDAGMLMLQDEVVFFAAELTGFVQDVVGDAEFTDFVEDGGNFELSALFVGPAEEFGDATGDDGHSLAVQQAGRVAHAHGAEDRGDEVARHELPFCAGVLIATGFFAHHQQSEQDGV